MHEDAWRGPFLQENQHEFGSDGLCNAALAVVNQICNKPSEFIAIAMLKLNFLLLSCWSEYCSQIPVWVNYNMYCNLKEMHAQENEKKNMETNFV